MTSGVVTPEMDGDAAEEEGIPSISATAVDEVAARRLEAINRALWARPWWWDFLVVLEFKNSGAALDGNDTFRRT